MAGCEGESWARTLDASSSAAASACLKCGTWDSLGKGRAGEAIDVLVPDGPAAISTACRGAAGRIRRVFVRAPLVLVLPPGQDCSMDCVRPDKTLVLRLSLRYYVQQVRAVLGQAMPLVPRFAVVDPFIRAITTGLLDQLHGGQGPSAAYLEPLGAVLSVHLARHYGAAAAGSDGGACALPPHRLMHVQAFVRDHLSEVLHVERLAAQVHMSQFHFARMFKHATGQPPHLYVVMQRVNHARALLQETELPLLEVAERTGFRTQGHFTGVFRRYTGTTPRTFRLACRAAQPCVHPS